MLCNINILYAGCKSAWQDQWENLYILEREVKRIIDSQPSTAVASTSALPRNVFLRHDRVLCPRPQFFDPSRDVRKHYIAITFVPQEQSAVPMRGWDLVLVLSSPQSLFINGSSHDVVNVLYLKPLRHNQSNLPQWKEPFLGHTFVRMMRPPRLQAPYDASYFTVKNIVFSFEPAGSIGKGVEELYADARLKIPKKHQGTVKHIISTINEFHATHSHDQQREILARGAAILPRVDIIPQDGDGEDED